MASVSGSRSSGTPIQGWIEVRARRSVFAASTISIEGPRMARIGSSSPATTIKQFSLIKMRPETVSVGYPSLRLLMS